ncbi:MAG: hypothetical protein JRI25_09960 [Deltaproteobacteria bacterium]|nr:hypothetical protein [Deltaproteobacteria bacterium]MBW2254905.1 hypothetical protein [Deltaproteobacteria bacterium]
MRLALVLLLLAGCDKDLGDRCTEHADCVEIPDAYCAGAGVCTRDCTDAACDEGSTCVQLESREICLRACTRDGQCLPREYCDEEHDACIIEDPLANP